MASNVQQVAAIVAAATTIQVISTVNQHKDPIPNFVGGAVFFVMLVILGAILGGRYDVPKLIAGVTLLGVVLAKGWPLFQNVNKLIVGVQTAPTKTK